MCFEFEYINNFKEFSEFLRTTKSKEKGDHFEVLCKYVILLHPIFNNEVKNCWLYNDIPYNISKKLELPKNDKGLDLLIEYKNGKYGVVQCKYRSNTHEVVSYTELSTFFAQILQQDRNHGRIEAILMTNTESVVTEVHSNKVRAFTNNIFEELDEEFFNGIRTLIETNSKPIDKKKDLRKFQIDCINKVSDHLETAINAQINNACGTGKSLIVYHVDKKMGFKRTVIFVPSLYLLSQMYMTFVKEAKGEYEYLLIGSDADIEEDYGGVNITTDPDVIREKFNTDRKLVVICTYQSSDKLRGYEFEFGIFDEAHKTVSNTEACFSFALFNKNIIIPRRLFVTATKKVYSGNNEEVLCMNNEEIYGPTVFEYNIRQAINENFLCDYLIEIMKIDNVSVEKYKIENEHVSDEGDIYGAHYISCMLMIKQLFERNLINHLLTFHSSISRAIEFSELLSKFLPCVKVYHINGSMSCKERNKIIKSFKEDALAIITSVNALSEGVDIPVIDSVCFAEGRSSMINVIQCIGRALRLYTGKMCARILVPIVETELEENTIFENLIKIIKTLSVYDSSVIEYFKARTNGDEVNKKLINVSNLEEGLEVDIANIDMSIFENKIDTIVYDSAFNRVVNDTTYEQARKMNISKEIKSKHMYFQCCSTFLPKDPETVFKGKFTTWIEYLGIKRNYYELEECKEVVKRLLLENPEIKNNFLEIDNICEKLCSFDKMFPPNGLWCEYYKIEDLQDIIVIINKKKKSTLIF